MAKQTFTTGQVLTAAQMTSLQQTAMGGGSATAKTASYVLVAADAGTTVAMNAAGATTITVNTGLFAAGDTVFIQNLGAGACTVTAGTATVATAGSLILPQNDAGILYFTATGAAIFYDYIQAGAVSPLTTKGDLYTFSTSDARLGVGANNTVLTADSAEATGLKWATIAGGAFTLLSTTTLSGSQTTVSSISGSYLHLYIAIDRVDMDSTCNEFYFDCGGGGNFRVIYVANATWSNSSGALLLFNQGLSINPNNSAGVFLMNYAATNMYKPAFSFGGNINNASADRGFLSAGYVSETAAITTLNVRPSSNLMTGGTMRIYGVN